MKLDVKTVKISVTVPKNNIDEVRQAMCDSGAGIIGNYSFCSTTMECLGTFIPNNEANPYIGENNKLEYVEEEKIEVICNIDIAKEVIKKIREVHPYEEPAIDIIPLLNEKEL